MRFPTQQCPLLPHCAGSSALSEHSASINIADVHAVTTRGFQSEGSGHRYSKLPGQEGCAAEMRGLPCIPWASCSSWPCTCGRHCRPSAWASLCARRRPPGQSWRGMCWGSPKQHLSASTTLYSLPFMRYDAQHVQVAWGPMRILCIGKSPALPHRCSWQVLQQACLPSKEVYNRWHCVLPSWIRRAA
jgi:hypothetical protein